MKETEGMKSESRMGLSGDEGVHESDSGHFNIQILRKSIRQRQIDPRKLDFDTLDLSPARGRSEGCHVMETRSSLLALLGDPSNTEAWAEFVSLYKPLLMAYARRRGLDEHQAGDLVQDVLFQLIGGLKEFKLDRSRGRFRTWLWTVTQNALITKARKERRRDQARNGWCQRMLAADVSESRRLEEEFDRMRRQRVLEKAFESIRASTRPKTWACFEEHLQKARPGAEVAVELELTVDAVYVNASRVLQRIRLWCADHLEDIDDDDSGWLPAR
jgi:RNA polymerase sigma factor (sigma-70 family)